MVTVYKMFFNNIVKLILQNFLDVYRMRHREKTSSFRTLFYALFGYVVSGVFYPAGYLINIFMVTSGIMAVSLLNDYYDYLKLGEKNAIGQLVSSKSIKKNGVALLFFIPAITMIGLIIWQFMLYVSRLPLFLWFISFLLMCFYSVPPLRFKERKIVGLFIPSIFVFSIFLQGLLMFKYPQREGWLLAVLVLLFILYIELSHLIDDSFQIHEFKKIEIRHNMMLLRLAAIIGIILSSLFFFYNPFFIISAVAWLLRFHTIRKIDAQEIVRARRNIFHPLWRLEEFFVYGVFSLIKMFSGINSL